MPFYVGLNKPLKLRPSPFLLKRAQRGLYDGARVLTGVSISFSDKKTRRTWKPNVQHKQIWSELMQRNLSINVTARALRTIDKHGGLDNYLMFTKDEKLGSAFGVKMKNILIGIWEKKNGKQFNAKQIQFTTRAALPRRGGAVDFAETTSTSTSTSTTSTLNLSNKTTATSGSSAAKPVEARQFSSVKKVSIKVASVSKSTPQQQKSLDDLD